MGKYANLINDLFDRGKLRKANYDALAKANARAAPFICEALKSHDDECVRETCAEILGDRGSSRVMPDLIDALLDSCLFVRQDALWAIEKICCYKESGLSFWLDLDLEDARDMHAKVLKWWKLNRRYIEGNEAFE